MKTHVMLLPAMLLWTACGAGADDERVDAVLAVDGDEAVGEDYYMSHCTGCHATDASGGSGPKLAGVGLEDREIAEALLSGPGSMPDFSDESDETLAGLVAYVGSLQ